MLFFTIAFMRILQSQHSSNYVHNFGMYCRTTKRQLLLIKTETQSNIQYAYN